MFHQVLLLLLKHNQVLGLQDTTTTAPIHEEALAQHIVNLITPSLNGLIEKALTSVLHAVNNTIFCVQSMLPQVFHGQ